MRSRNKIWRILKIKYKENVSRIRECSAVKTPTPHTKNLLNIVTLEVISELGRISITERWGLEDRLVLQWVKRKKKREEKERKER